MYIFLLKRQNSLIGRVMKKILKFIKKKLTKLNHVKVTIYIIIICRFFENLYLIISYRILQLSFLMY